MQMNSDFSLSHASDNFCPSSFKYEGFISVECVKPTLAYWLYSAPCGVSLASSLFRPIHEVAFVFITLEHIYCSERFSCLLCNATIGWALQETAINSYTKGKKKRKAAKPQNLSYSYIHIFLYLLSTRGLS